MNKEHGDKALMGIIYPKGIIRGIFFSEELKLALSNGYKLFKIYSGYEYLTKEILFDDFVIDIYNKRITTESSILKDFYKKILNTLYGRFGLIYEKTKANTTESQHENKAEEGYISLTSTICYNNISIASAITSYARIHMYNILKNENANLFYWDTDGIFTSHTLSKDIVTTTKELGKFRLESHNKDACFISNKFYFYQTMSGIYVNKFKGINTSDALFNYNNILNTYKQVITTNNSSTFVLRIKDEKNNKTYGFRFAQKRKTKKGKNHNTLWETHPWVINKG